MAIVLYSRITPRGLLLPYMKVGKIYAPGRIPTAYLDAENTRPWV